MESDVKIAEQVRRVLTRHWVDLAELRFTATRGTVRFHGKFRRLPTEEPLSIAAPLLETVTQEIQRVPGVKKVYFTGVEIDEPWVEAELIEEEEEQA